MLLLTLPASACDSSLARERAEAERIVRRIEVLRDATLDGKEAALNALRDEPCSEPEPCELKQICADGYRLFAASAEKRRTLARALARPHGVPAVSSASTLLASAQAELEVSRDLITQCAELEGALRRIHGL